MNNNDQCGAVGPNGLACEKELGHENEPKNRMHHAPKPNRPGGHMWLGEYTVIRNRRSVYGTGGD